MDQRPSRNHRLGQSLAEVVIAVSVVVLIITGLVAGTTASLRTSQFNRARSLATKYAQEAMERARGLRDSGWTTFLTYGDSFGNVWCLTSDGQWKDVTSTCDVSDIIDSMFTRTVTFTWDEINEKMDVRSIVTWRDATGIHNVTLTSALTHWR